MDRIDGGPYHPQPWVSGVVSLSLGFNMVTTSSLVVELLVIGVGATSWLLLLVASVFGNSWLLTIQPFATLLAIPALAMVYTLGIVSDRMIDAIFGLCWGGSLRRRHFSDNVSYHHARRTVLTGSDRMADMIEYSRSRMRICRGWAVHSLLIALALNLYCWLQIENHSMANRIHLFGTALFCVLGVTSWHAWRNLASTQYLQVREQSQFLTTKNDNRQQAGLDFGEETRLPQVT